MELDDAKRKRACPSTISLAGDPDRLSALPDCLLHTIMNFMKARQVVQMCVLSMRWRHLWRSVPCLNIDFDEFKTAAHTVPYDSDTDSDNGNDKEWEDFRDFAVNLMLRRSIAALDSFRLHVGRDKVPCCGHRQAGGWLRHAMKYYAPDPVIQREGLSSRSWCLRRLHLCHVVVDYRFAEHVTSVCHSLEDLELDACACEIHSISSQSLKNLVLKNCRWYKLSEIISPTLKTLVIDGGSILNTCLLVILAPAVAYLHLAVNVGYFHSGISINEMPSLAKALIHLRGGRGVLLKSELRSHQFKLLYSVSNVKSLELKSFITMVLGEESTPFQEFKNLRNLLLDDCYLTDDFQTLGLFLQSSPNLEKLTLRRCKFLNDPKKKKGTHKPNKPTSSQYRSLDVQCKNLKLTEIIYKDDDVRPLVELLLCISGKLPKNYIKLTKVD